MPKENLSELHRRLSEQCKLSKEELCPIVEIDIPMPIRFVTKTLVQELAQLEPLGKGNQKPVFAEQHFKILRGRKLGKTKNVLSMEVQDDEGTKIEAIMFRDVDRFELFLQEEFSESEIEKMYNGVSNQMDVAFTYYPSVNTYNGNEKMQIQITGYCRIERRS